LLRIRYGTLFVFHGLRSRPYLRGHTRMRVTVTCIQDKRRGTQRISAVEVAGNGR